MPPEPYLAVRGVGERLMGLLRRNRLEGRTPASLTQLAEQIGISRQTLSAAANDRLTRHTAEAVAKGLGLEVEELLGSGSDEAPEQWEPPPDQPDEASAQGIELEEYVGNMDRIVRTLRSVSGGPLSIPIKLALLDGVKGAAADAGATLPREFFEIRRRVLAGEL